MVLIPGGTYTIGSWSGGRSAQPQHQVTLESFQIGRYEVTNREFVAFLNSLDLTLSGTAPFGRVERSQVRGSLAENLFDFDTDPPRTNQWYELNDSQARIGVRAGRFAIEPGYEDHPVAEVTWFGANAYAQWRGCRLPTEVEWEAAARGPEGRTYPWGEERPTRERAVFGTGQANTAPVGTHPAGATPNGINDMAGNVAEYTSTLKRPYPYRANDGREDQAEDGLGLRVARGGDHSFDSAPSQLTTYFRDTLHAELDAGHHHVGFRLACPAER